MSHDPSPRASDGAPDRAAAGIPGAGRMIGGCALGAVLRRTAAATVYRADKGGTATTVHVLHAPLAARPEIVRALQAGATQAAAASARNVAATIGAGFEDGILYAVAEAEGGPTLREVLDRKRAQSGAGLPPRGAGNVIATIAQGLLDSGAVHGALSAESIVLARQGQIAIVDLAVGPALAAAVAAGVVPAPGWMAPEVAQGAAPTPASDVYALGALLYDALVGRPLARGGPRPSEAAPGMPPEVDELIARACAEKPERRFGSVAALRELVIDILLTVDEEAVDVGDAPALVMAIPPALEAAMQDEHERWLVSKGHFDFGPFSMKQIVDQIRVGQIHHGHVLMDKDEGGRAKVDEHPLLGPLVDAAKHARDHARRAHAEVKHQASERKRGVALYGVIGAGVCAAVAAAYLVVTTVSGAKQRQVEGVASLAEASLQVTVSAPKPPAKKAGGARGGGGARRGGHGGGNADENLALDMSDENDGGSEQLDMGTVYGVYARYGNQLGRCLQKTGAGSAAISIIIDGPTGRVNWVKVNGESSGALHGCLAGVLRSMRFPTVDGPRTRAEFEIAM